MKCKEVSERLLAEFGERYSIDDIRCVEGSRLKIIHADPVEFKHAKEIARAALPFTVAFENVI